MADRATCERALAQVATRLARVDGESRGQHSIGCSVSVEVTDLGLTWTGRLAGSLLTDLTTDLRPRAQVRLRTTIDNLRLRRLI